MKKVILIATIMLTLAACESQPAKTLDQKLAETATPADRKETLRLACLNEAEWPKFNSSYYKTANPSTKRHMRNRYNSEVNGMKSLCRQMDDLTSADAEEKLSPKKLASACAAQITAKKAKERKGGAEHAKRIESICKKMTNSTAR